MKGTEKFKEVIKAHLDNKAQEDELFAKSYAKDSKSIDDCITYILNYVQKSGCQGFEDEEIYGLAIHYYDEDDIDVGRPVNCNVIVNHAVELTQEEIEKAKEDARKKIEQEAYEKMHCSKKPKKEKLLKVIFSVNTKIQLAKQMNLKN